VIGPALMAAFNLKVYGHLTSPYMQVSRESGFDLATIPQKFVSLFDDSSALFLTPRQTFLARFPWLAITMAMMPSVLVFGPNILQLITVLAVVHVAMYLGYGDLHPEMLYTYHLIHYFKLYMPYFALIAVCGLLFLFQRRTTAKSGYVAISGIVLAIFLCALDFHLRDEPIRTTVIGAHSVSIEPMTGSQATVDFIDFPNLASDVKQKYVCCDNQFVANGKKLRRLGDVHLFKGGTAARPFTRAFFTSGLTFDKLVITFDDSFRLPADLAAEGVRYSIGIRWLATDAKQLLPTVSGLVPPSPQPMSTSSLP